MARHEGTQYVPKQEQRIVRSEASDGTPVDVVLLEGLRLRLVKFILPLLMTHVLLLLGMPRIGKTRFVIIVALAYGSGESESSGQF